MLFADDPEDSIVGTQLHCCLIHKISQSPRSQALVKKFRERDYYLVLYIFDQYDVYAIVLRCYSVFYGSNCVSQLNESSFPELK